MIRRFYLELLVWKERSHDFSRSPPKRTWACFVLLEAGGGAKVVAFLDRKTEARSANIYSLSVFQVFLLTKRHSRSMTFQRYYKNSTRKVNFQQLFKMCHRFDILVPEKQADSRTNELSSNIGHHFCVYGNYADRWNIFETSVLMTSPHFPLAMCHSTMSE